MTLSRHKRNVNTGIKDWSLRFGVQKGKPGNALQVDSSGRSTLHQHLTMKEGYVVGEESPRNSGGCSPLLKGIIIGGLTASVVVGLAFFLVTLTKAEYSTEKDVSCIRDEMKEMCCRISALEKVAKDWECECEKMKQKLAEAEKEDCDKADQQQELEATAAAASEAAETVARAKRAALTLEKLFDLPDTLVEVN
ncbi:uncharacterized protein [Branchiostoma lanceolatum]|uniref:uncharacterized protein n=1 Tax=Branchiostoma lanceolatum TaxID=7740 RepID=UPI0034558647